MYFIMKGYISNVSILYYKKSKKKKQKSYPSLPYPKSSFERLKSKIAKGKGEKRNQ